MPRHLLAILTAALVAAVACAVSAVGLWRSPPGPVPTARVVTPSPTPSPTPSARPSPAPGVAAPAVPEAVAVLRSWDARRSRAWARDDPVALSALYVPGAPAGAHDASMLHAWSARGVRVRGLSTQLLAVDSLGRSATRWRLRVTDRLAGGTAVGRDLRLPLPRDEASTRTVVLQRWAGEWRVASVVTSTPDTG